MATLPRVNSSKRDVVIPFPFSTSPRKLQEVSLPVSDTHNITSTSGVSMKQFEDQLIALRRENFQLKLRIYFLEEKLGTGAPPSVQGMLEHNVRLQVEVEELRRQLCDKQELLAAAAEAIVVMEQQGSMSTDSVEASLNNSAFGQKNDVVVKSEEEKIDPNEQTCEETCVDSEPIRPSTTVKLPSEGMDELVKLRRENRNGLQVIKECVKKIKQQDKEIKKLKLDKDLVSDSQPDKYGEIVRCKDEHIRELEARVAELQRSGGARDEAGNLQELLTRRLQGLTYFLDKLLSHKCVLGEDKKKLVESILEQSLALPVGLQLDESLAPGDFTMDESALDVSQSLRMQDLTMMFGHHRLSEAPRRGRAQAESESECWSEPDRNVSLARMGLPPGSEPARPRARRSRLSYSRTDDKTCDAAVFEELSQLARQVEQLECEKSELGAELQRARDKFAELVEEKNKLVETLASERSNVIEANKSSANHERALSEAMSKLKDADLKLKASAMLVESLRSEKLELQSTFEETEVCLRRAADEAALQASAAGLESARAVHERLRAERERDAARAELAQREEAAARRELAAVLPRVLPRGPPSDDDRPVSPDQGIDSDRLSSLEHNDGVALSPRSLYEENITLKQKLARTKATLAETVARLNANNQRKNNVQRAICREIHKSNDVLRKARDMFESQN